MSTFLKQEQTNFNYWNAASIAERQVDMAHKAMTAWRINYL
jgi:hypothetical protein